MTQTKPRIYEVGPRDGLQNENILLPVDEKLNFIKLLVDAGCKDIEAGAFVHPQLIPQMANSHHVLPLAIVNFPEVNFHALVPNLKGLDNALKCGVRHIGLLTSMCGTFAKRNLNATFSESLERLQKIISQSPENTYKRLYISMSFYSTWSGEISNETFEEKVQKLSDLKVDEFVLSDTNGRATPENVHQKINILSKYCESKQIACHFHDTYGHAIDNIQQAWTEGVFIFDSSCAGIGGCPYSPGATGNVSTKAVIDFFEKQSQNTGINSNLLAVAESYIIEKLETN